MILPAIHLAEAAGGCTHTAKTPLKDVKALLMSSLAYGCARRTLQVVNLTDPVVGPGALSAAKLLAA